MKPKVQIINPLDYPHWDDLVLSAKGCSFFHSSSWARVLCESYRYKPLYYTAVDNDTLSALLPLMEIKSLLTGRRGVSLPFTDECRPFVPDRSYFKEIIGNFIQYGKSPDGNTLN